MVLLGSSLLNREISLKTKYDWRTENHLPKREGKICFLDGWRSCDPEKTYDQVSLAFLQCKLHADMGKTRAILCVVYCQCHTEVTKAVPLTLPCEH